MYNELGLQKIKLFFLFFIFPFVVKAQTDFKNDNYILTKNLWGDSSKFERVKLYKKDSIQVAGILYAPPNYLRMGMYLELSRPAGDTSRWEKVLKRLTLLNKNYPFDPVIKHHLIRVASHSGK